MRLELRYQQRDVGDRWRSLRERDQGVEPSLVTSPNARKHHREPKVDISATGLEDLLQLALGEGPLGATKGDLASDTIPRAALQMRRHTLCVVRAAHVH